jgi:hypothetical protein
MALPAVVFGLYVHARPSRPAPGALQWFEDSQNCAQGKGTCKRAHAGGSWGRGAGTHTHAHTHSRTHARAHPLVCPQPPQPLVVPAQPGQYQHLNTLFGGAFSFFRPKTASQTP